MVDARPRAFRVQRLTVWLLPLSATLLACGAPTPRPDAAPHEAAASADEPAASTAEPQRPIRESPREPPAARPLPPLANACDAAWITEQLDDLAEMGAQTQVAPRRPPLVFISPDGDAAPPPPPPPRRESPIERDRGPIALAMVHQACPLPAGLTSLPDDLMGAPPDRRRLVTAKAVLAPGALPLLSSACADVRAAARAIEVAPNLQASTFAKRCRLDRHRLATAAELSGRDLHHVMLGTLTWSHLRAKDIAKPVARRVFRVLSGIGDAP